MEEIKIIEELFKTGQLNSISSHLLEFVRRHKRDIRELAGEQSNSDQLMKATTQLIRKRGSIHLPSEMADQIREINNEIWYRGERGDFDRSKIQEEWAMKYAAVWRNFRTKEILYVLEQKWDEIERILGE